MMCPTNIEWLVPFWVSFHLLQVGANGIARPDTTHHAFSCKLTLCSCTTFCSTPQQDCVHLGGHFIHKLQPIIFALGS
jgi:hypothetical protein